MQQPVLAQRASLILSFPAFSHPCLHLLYGVQSSIIVGQTPEEDLPSDKLTLTMTMLLPHILTRS